MVASKYTKSTLINITQQKKKEKKKKTRSYANVWLSADINIYLFVAENSSHIWRKFPSIICTPNLKRIGKYVSK